MQQQFGIEWYKFYHRRNHKLLVVMDAHSDLYSTRLTARTVGSALQGTVEDFCLLFHATWWFVCSATQQFYHTLIRVPPFRFLGGVWSQHTLVILRC